MIPTLFYLSLVLGPLAWCSYKLGHLNGQREGAERERARWTQSVAGMVGKGPM